MEYRLMDWMYRYKKIGGWMRMDVNNYVLYSDIQVAPVYERNVKITLDAGEGTLVGEDYRLWLPASITTGYFCRIRPGRKRTNTVRIS